MEINNANSDTYSFNYTYYMCTYNSDFYIKKQFKAVCSGLEQRINGSVKMVFRHNIGKSTGNRQYADKPFCTNGQRNQKYASKYGKTPCRYVQRFRRYIRTFIRCK